jgi:catechol 2,3-dioxygenase
VGPAPTRTKIGRVNLQVADLEAAFNFYRDRLGLPASNLTRAIGWGDLGTGDRRTHIIALNVWQGVGAPTRPRTMAGMDHFTIRFGSPKHLRRVLRKLEDLEQRRDTYLAHDPGGNAMVLTV